jgi:hypothetical protein
MTFFIFFSRSRLPYLSSTHLLLTCVTEAGAMDCFNNEVNESVCLDGVVEKLVEFVCIPDESSRTVVLLGRTGLLSVGDMNRVKYDEESGEPLVPREFGGVRCRLIASSV